MSETQNKQSNLKQKLSRLKNKKTVSMSKSVAASLAAEDCSRASTMSQCLPPLVAPFDQCRINATPRKENNSVLRLNEKQFLFIFQFFFLLGTCFSCFFWRKFFLTCSSLNNSFLIILLLSTIYILHFCLSNLRPFPSLDFPSSNVRLQTFVVNRFALIHSFLCFAFLVV